MRLLMLLAVTAALAASSAALAQAAVGPPGGTIYANGVAYQTVGTPTSLPDHGSFDTLYMIDGFAAVSDAAPGSPGYNGGRWRVVQVTGTFTSQPTSAEEVLAQATSLTDTGTRFVCPLIRA